MQGSDAIREYKAEIVADEQTYNKPSGSMKVDCVTIHQDLRLKDPVIACKLSAGLCHDRTGAYPGRLPTKNLPLRVTASCQHNAVSTAQLFSAVPAS